MKLSLIIFATAALIASCTSPNKPAADIDTLQQSKLEHRHRGHPIERIVSDLTDAQKEQLHSIMENSHSRLDSLHSMQNSIRDSINQLNDQYGDHSADIFPLYQREAELQVAINKEYYHNKLRMDSVLTEEQFFTLTTKMRDHRRDHHDHRGDHHFGEGHHHDHRGDHHDGQDSHHHHE